MDIFRFSLTSRYDVCSDLNRLSDFEYIQHTIFNIKKKITLIYPRSAAMGFCLKGLKNEFETAMVNEPSVFEPLKFYCKQKNLPVLPFLQRGLTVVTLSLISWIGKLFIE